jgi:hypothetical protein
MGGSGSGRMFHFSSKGTTESMQGLDIRKLYSDGLLKPNLSFSVSWDHNRMGKDTIIMKTEQDAIRLFYRNRSAGETEWQDIETPVRITWSKCNYGGYRPWFLCPKCYKRVAILYGGKYFLCRHCHHLVYESQNEGNLFRQAASCMNKARKIRRRLGASENVDSCILDKPKYMHWKTFERLKEEVWHLEGYGWKAASMALTFQNQNS